mgnify:CR=1 FL=1
MNIYDSSEITVHKLNELKEEDKNIQIIDIRDDTERNHASVKGTIHIKLTEIADRYTELDKNRNIFVMCHTGTRSQAVVKWLKTKGYDHGVNVLGGIDAWAALIDRDIRRY